MTPQPWPHPPIWLRAPRLPETLVVVVMATIVAVGAITYVRDLDGARLMWGLAALGLSTVGCAMASLPVRAPDRQRWTQWVGLAVACCAPVVAGAAGLDPIIEWNLVVFVACGSPWGATRSSQ
ncbi:MAG: hypothetical protein FWE61_06185 [Micrococcales bacterium]|nr:hypothetical protein [Micrococcales bacterium]